MKVRYGLVSALGAIVLALSFALGALAQTPVVGPTTFTFTAASQSSVWNCSSGQSTFQLNVPSGLTGVFTVTVGQTSSTATNTPPSSYAPGTGGFTNTITNSGSLTVTLGANAYVKVADTTYTSGSVTVSGSCNGAGPGQPGSLLVSTNSILTKTTLGSNGTYTSAWFDTVPNGQHFVQISGYSDQSGSFVIQQTDDQSNSSMTNVVNSTTTTGSTPFSTGLVTITGRYWQVVFTNGGTSQTLFELADTTSQAPPQTLVQFTPQPTPVPCASGTPCTTTFGGTPQPVYQQPSPYPSASGQITVVDSNATTPPGTGQVIVTAPTSGSYFAYQCTSNPCALVEFRVSGLTAGNNIYPERSVDSTNGSNGGWTSYNVWQMGLGGSFLPNYYLNSNGIYQGNTSGASWIRWRSTGTLTTTATITMISSSAGTNYVFPMGAATTLGSLGPMYPIFGDNPANAACNGSNAGAACNVTLTTTAVNFITKNSNAAESTYMTHLWFGNTSATTITVNLIASATSGCGGASPSGTTLATFIVPGGTQGGGTNPVSPSPYDPIVAPPNEYVCAYLSASASTVTAGGTFAQMVPPFGY